ncbi:MAG: prolyl oligopeptidase family serine peptidase [Myxococcales bacterium]
MTRTRTLCFVVVGAATASSAFLGCSSDSQGPDTPAQAGSGPGAHAGSGSPAQAGAGASGSPAVGGSGAVGQSGGSSTGGSDMTGSAGAGLAGQSAGGSLGSGGGGQAGGAGGGNAGDGGTPSGGGGSMTPGMSAGCGKAPTIASDMYNNGKNIPITAANLQRRYILSVPTNYDNKKPYKLVIAWHQRDGNDNQMYRNKYYHLQPLSNDTTIFVAPNGQLNGKPCVGTGNGEASCGWPNTNDSDMALADAVVKQVEDNFCVDTNRIFATGWSYGGSMSYATACERPLGAANGYIRAIAVYSGARLSGSCTASKPVAYYASHGTHDSVLNYSNGLTLAQDFAKANGCTWATPTAVMSGNHVCTDLMGCKTGYPEQFCSFNGDHTPDPSDGGGTSWEYANVWKFLSQF